MTDSAPVIIPSISLKDFAARRDEIKAQLIDAAENIGFFTLLDHGISEEEVNTIFETSKQFFDLPAETKQKTPFTGKNQGYEIDSQVRPSTGYADPKESIQLSVSEEDSMLASWPAETDAPGFKQNAIDFIDKVQTVSHQVLELFAEAMGLPLDTFTKSTVSTSPDKSDTMTTLRLLKYYDCTGKDFGDNYFRGGAHCDFDILTMLFQRVGQDGLEVCPGRAISTDFGYGDTWTPIKVTDPTMIICNIGDQLMRWSDDRFKSTFHRVRCPRPGQYQGDRYSIALFNQALKGALIQGPKKAYPEITGAEFIAQAMKRNYDAQLKAKNLKTYEIREETLEANKGFEISGTGLTRPKVVA